MFPPETSSNVLPWHVLVPVMQICGCFPYRMSATGGTPTFSLSLLLWAVAVELFMFPVYFMANRIISEQHLTSEFGTFALVYSWGVSCTVVCLTPILLGVKSATLAALLHELSGMQGIFPPVARRWYCRPKALALLSLCMFWIGFQMYVAITWRMEQFFEIFSSVFAAFMYTMNSVVPTQLCSMLFGLLARHVEAATEATVVTVSSLLIPDGSFKCDKDVEVAMLALRDLDAVIREV